MQSLLTSRVGHVELNTLILMLTDILATDILGSSLGSTFTNI